VSNLNYLSSNFQPEIVGKIEEQTTASFSICTAYTSLSYIETMVANPIFSNKLDSLLIGDPISLGFDGKREKITNILKKNGDNRVFFANLGKYNVKKNTWAPIIHSKIYIGYDDQKIPIWAFIGSVNFSENGMKKHRESLVYISETNTLLEVNEHFEELKELCEVNSKLNLNRFSIKRINPPYLFQIVDNSNPMNNIHIIIVMIETHELEDVKKAKEIRLDLFEEKAPLFRLLKKGTVCEFILIFATKRPLKDCSKVVVKFAKSVASVDPQSTADHDSTYHGYVRYHDGKTIVDWDENPPPSNTALHQRSLKVLKPERENLSGKNKPLKQKMVNEYLDCTNGDMLSLVLDKSSDHKVKSELTNPNPDNEDEILLKLSEIQLVPSHSVKLSEKLDKEDMEKIDADEIHNELKYSLKSQVSESFVHGQEIMKKDFKVTSYVVPKYFIDNSTSVQPINGSPSD
jgi:hypothetical protein